MSRAPDLESPLSNAFKRDDHVLALLAGFPSEQRVVPVLPQSIYPDDPETWFAKRNAEPVGLVVWRKGAVQILIRPEFRGQPWVEDGLRQAKDQLEALARA